MGVIVCNWSGQCSAVILLTLLWINCSGHSCIDCSLIVAPYFYALRVHRTVNPSKFSSCYGTEWKKGCGRRQRVRGWRAERYTKWLRCGSWKIWKYLIREKKTGEKGQFELENESETKQRQFGSLDVQRGSCWSVCLDESVCARQNNSQSVGLRKRDFESILKAHKWPSGPHSQTVSCTNLIIICCWVRRGWETSQREGESGREREMECVCLSSSL